MDTTNLKANLEQYCDYLAMEEKNQSTVYQYRKDILQFFSWLEEQEEREELTKEAVIAYKEKLPQRYKPTTINAKLAALNSFFTYLDRSDLRVKQLKIQHQIFCSKDRELTQAEYDRLVKAAKDSENDRLDCILETICSTGIRVSELQFITVETVLKEETSIQLKGKVRPLMLPKKLRKLLKDYIEKHHLIKGPVFVTRTGQPLDRSNIWRMMKELCAKARVDPHKVFPHNLRHLFARVFYSTTKDIAKLADILGHSSINTTRIYIISTGEEHQIILDSLNFVS